MRDLLYWMLCSGVFIIGIVLAVDSGIQVRHLLSGTPTDRRMWEHMIEKSNQAIESQAVTIKTQAETIRQLKRRIKTLSSGEDTERGV